MREDQLRQILDKQRNSPYLQLSDLQLTDKLCLVAAQFMENFSHYKKVNLGYNQITPKGLAAMVAQMSKFKYLKELNLDFNKLGGTGTGLGCLVDLFTNNPGIRVAVIRNNDLNDDDASTLAQAIGADAELARLDLRHNQITTTGAQILLGAAQQNSKICELDLFGNNIDHKTFASLRTTLEKNQSRQPTSVPVQSYENRAPTRSPPRPAMRTVPLPGVPGRVSFVPGGSPLRGTLPGPPPPGPLRPLNPALVNREILRTNELRDRYQLEADTLHEKQIHEEKVITTLRRDVDSLAQENEFLIEDNRKLKNELDDMEIRRKGKIGELEKRKDIQNENIIALESEQQMRIKGMVEEHQARIVDLNREWDNRMKHIADQVDFSKVTNNKLEEEVRRLTEELHSLRNRQEAELRDLETTTREKEYQKYNNNLRRAEDKLIALEQNREITNKKYYDMVRELQGAEKKLNDELISAESEADGIKKENGDLKHRVEQMKIECDKMEKHLKLKSDHLRKLEDEIETLQLKGQDQKKHHGMEHHKAIGIHEEDKLSWRQGKEIQRAKILDLERRLRESEAEYNCLKTDYQKLADLLQNNISKVVYETFMHNDYF